MCIRMVLECVCKARTSTANLCSSFTSLVMQLMLYSLTNSWLDYATHICTLVTVHSVFMLAFVVLAASSMPYTLCLASRSHPSAHSHT